SDRFGIVPLLVALSAGRVDVVVDCVDQLHPHLAADGKRDRIVRNENLAIEMSGNRHCEISCKHPTAIIARSRGFAFLTLWGEAAAHLVFRNRPWEHELQEIIRAAGLRTDAAQFEPPER